MNCDVLVVGAGPVGLTMAAELSRYGIAVRIVEKNAVRTDKSKALVVWGRTLELMNRMGCVESFLATGMEAHAANVWAGPERIARISFDDADTPYAFALMIPQNETERLMEEFLNGLGVRVERTVELVGFTQSDTKTADGVIATVRHGDGKEETIESLWLIGCDGAHSTVRHQLGMDFAGSTQTSDWMLADAHISGVEAPGEVSAYWHSDGVLILFPIDIKNGQTRYRVIADLGETVAGNVRPDPTLAEVQAILDKRGPGGMTLSDPIWLANFHINERKVAEYRSGRIFLTGDAAHIHSPAGGQGMNTGMQDAINLAWKLAMVTRGVGADDPVLESYSPERSGVGDQVLKAAGRFTEVAILQGRVKQAIRNHLASMLMGFHAVRKFALNAAEEVSIHYPESPLNGSGAHKGMAPVAGDRAPIRADETPIGAGNKPRFAVCGDADERFAELVAALPRLLEAEIRKPYQEGGLWVVRPDGYVALATKAGDWDGVGRYCERVAGKP
jgi:2-polyprenyl-6-methoxyphenol hydroxylase-like FAD-dependent oxidoreductase